MTKLLEVRGVSKAYHDQNEKIEVLKEVSFSMNRGDFFSIQGPSGSGKSTLLNILGALAFPDSGEIELQGKKLSLYYKTGTIHQYRLKHIGFIFQNHNLMPDFTLLENVMMPLLIGSLSRQKAKEKAEKILDEVGLYSRASHYPSQISGGESQRAAVARAIVGKPSLILADEPTGNLDQKNSKKLIELILRILEKENLTVLVVTHDKTLAEAANKTFFLSDGRLS